MIADAQRFLLAIDTCGGTGSVAVVEWSEAETKIVAERALPGRETLEQLLPSVDAVLKESSLALSSVALFAVANGPGSFTGVRIGVAAVKGFAEAVGVPVVAVSRLRMLAHRAGLVGEVTALLDAGRGDVYQGTYLNGKTLHEEITRPEQITGANIVVGEENLRAYGSFIGLPGAKELAELAAQDAAENRFTDLLALDANYLRVPDAELALQAKR